MLPLSKKLPWEELPHVWKTESAFLSYIRGGIRRSLWNRNPVKLEFIKRNRIRIPNPSGKGPHKEIWGATCALTGATLPLKEMEVDHKEGNHSLRSLDDIQSFVKGIVLVSVDDLQWVSKEAHKVKSYAEKEGLSFEEALAVKKAIAKAKEGPAKVVEFLESKGYNPASTAPKRRDQLIEYYRREQ